MTNSLITAAAATLALAASALTPAVAQPTGAKNVVLVHGGFVDGSGWQGVYDMLKKGGYNVTIVQNPTTSLADDVAVTKRAIAGQDGPVVLVGHSYGGVVISEAGTDEKVKAVVYIAAFAPDKGVSVSSLIANPPAGAPVPRSCRRSMASCSSTRPSSPPPSPPMLTPMSRPSCRLAGSMGRRSAGWCRHRSGLEVQAELLPGRLRRPHDPSRSAAHDGQRVGAIVTETAGSHAVYVCKPEAVAAIIEQAAAAK